MVTVAQSAAKWRNMHTHVDTNKDLIYKVFDTNTKIKWIILTLDRAYIFSDDMQADNLITDHHLPPPPSSTVSHHRRRRYQ